MEKAGSVSNPSATFSSRGPLWVNAEITYKCPLHCVFCYNPVDYAKIGEELSTDQWLKALREARAVGAVQLGISGGEPLMRDDCEVLVTEAAKMGYYVNLLTSGIGLTEKRIAAFRAGGLSQIQLSFQDSTKEMNDFLSSTKTFDLKSKAAKLIKQYDYPMVLNVVLHRMNIDHIQQILEMAEAIGADHVELANTQYYAWAMVNRDQLLPSREQLTRAEAITNKFREHIGNKMKLYFVVPDYYSNRPKKCMNGWGSTFLNIAPDGLAMPCHEARMLPGLNLPNVKDHDIEWIWNESHGFKAYRGDSWMKEPCRTCDEKEKDWGGCRCQAYLLTGDATSTDPICDKSPKHDLITKVVEKAQTPGNPVKVHPIVFRVDKNSVTRSEPAKPEAAPVG